MRRSLIGWLRLSKPRGLEKSSNLKMRTRSSKLSSAA
jgi:hypothetical protein